MAPNAPVEGRGTGSGEGALQEQQGLLELPEVSSLATFAHPSADSFPAKGIAQDSFPSLAFLCPLALGLTLGLLFWPAWQWACPTLPAPLSLYPDTLPPAPVQLPYSRLPTVSPSTPCSSTARESSFLIVGDWGRDGHFNQSALAKAMGNVAEQQRSSFVVSTGDNFYETGLQHEGDAKFDSSFTTVYSSPSLQRLNWYSVLGNHDYVSNPDAQTGLGLRARDPRWHCSRSYQLRVEPPCAQTLGSSLACRPLLELFFVDTTPLMQSEWGPGGEKSGSRLNFSSLTAPDHATFTRMLTTALSEALAASDAMWKAVVGHHTLRSVGVHGDSPDLIRNLLPVMEAHGVDLYINGHDHNLQLIKRLDSPVVFVTSGAGSKAYRNQRAHAEDEGVLLDYPGQGFVDVTVGESDFSLHFRNLLGEQIYAHRLNRAP